MALQSGQMVLSSSSTFDRQIEASFEFSLKRLNGSGPAFGKIKGKPIFQIRPINGGIDVEFCDLVVAFQRLGETFRMPPREKGMCDQDVQEAG
jgi:hypothetical protein